MKFVEIRGGIGNQMFDYAFALSLFHHSNKKVYKGIAEITKKQEHNGYELDKVFGIRIGKIERQFIRFLPKRRFRKYCLSQYYEKAFYEYDETVFSQESNKLVDHYIGYWQNENYFKSIQKEIRKTYTFNEELFSPQTKNLANHLEKNSNCVSLHIRRGDYVNDSKVHAVLGGLCPIDYYRRAIEMILSKVSEASFYLFTDDPKWVKENFKLLKDATFVDWNNGVDSWQDMALMSKCSHHIIANSSFSWWGAWLATPHDKKLIIAPSQWMNISKSNAIVPASWIML